jgi:GrpB-like predicted nucleotidyltransferase (UPF0157 family)
VGLVIGPYQSGPAACHKHEPRSAEVAQAVAALIEPRLPGAQVEHIGSTSVPGCAGKGIIDLKPLTGLEIYPAPNHAVRLPYARDRITITDAVAELGVGLFAVGLIQPVRLLLWQANADHSLGLPSRHQLLCPPLL